MKEEVQTRDIASANSSNCKRIQKLFESPSMTQLIDWSSVIPIIKLGVQKWSREASVKHVQLNKYLSIPNHIFAFNRFFQCCYLHQYKAMNKIRYYFGSFYKVGTPSACLNVEICQRLPRYVQCCHDVEYEHPLISDSEERLNCKLWW